MNVRDGGGCVLGDVRLKVRGRLDIKDGGQRGSGREAVRMTRRNVSALKGISVQAKSLRTLKQKSFTKHRIFGSAAQILDARSPGPPISVQWCLIFGGPHYESSFMSPS